MQKSPEVRPQVRHFGMFVCGYVCAMCMRKCMFMCVCECGGCGSLGQPHAAGSKAGEINFKVNLIKMHLCTFCGN